MGVSETEFRKLYTNNTTATVITRNAFKEISGLKVQVKGIKGGDRSDAATTLWYTVFIDVDSIRSDVIPPVFILEPDEDHIRHVNVFHPQSCPKLGRSLPHVCWGGYNDYWRSQEKHNRTLVSLIKCLEKVLQNQNFGSRAR
jgi:hypothetical protein